jgi:RHS repeat-associated protein
MGSLVQSSEDASGLMYRRNRYYDPKTGRFTQEDPIGLAGGLNTYGFADGDPVSYEDPYGLCVDGVSTIACLYAAFEVASTLYDIGDLAVTGYRYTRGRVSGRELAVTAGGVAAGVVLFGGGYGSGARQLSRRLPFRDSDRLIEINRTLDRIEDGVKKFRQDGTTFRNREGKLPAKADGYYREWTVETPGASNRGARRVVQGQGGETYYTDDHYGSFIRVDARKQ